MKRYWEGDDGKTRKPKKRWASYRHGEFSSDGNQHVFRWGEGENINQKVVSSAIIAEALAISFVKNIREIPQDDRSSEPSN